MSTLKFIFVLFLTVPVFSKLSQSKLHFDENEIIFEDEAVEKNCEEGEFFDDKDLSCKKCTVCAEFMYERVACQGNKNSVCGWCGGDLNLKELNSEQFASFHLKCMRPSLEFIDMKKLEEKLGKDLFGTVDDDDTELDKDEYYSDEEDEESNDETAENKSDEENKEDEKEDDLDYTGLRELIKKHLQKQKTEEQIRRLRGEIIDDGEVDAEGVPKLPAPRKALLLFPREYMKKTFRNLIRRPVRLWPKETMKEDFSAESSEETSVEEDSEFDKWIDDKVRPIFGKRIGDKLKMEAEEIRNDDDDETLVVFENDDEQMDSAGMTNSLYKRLYGRLVIFFFFVVFLAVWIRVVCKVNRRNTRTIQLHPQDYKILQECGRRAEMSNKEKHVHENPLCLP